MVIRNLAPGRAGLVGNHTTPLEVHIDGAAPDKFRLMQAATQRRADVARLETATGHFGEHRGKKKRVRFAHQCDGDRPILAELLFQTGGGSHAGEAASKDNDPRSLTRLCRERLGFRTEDMAGEVVQTLREDTERRAIHDPADHRGEMRAHLLGSPLGHLPGERRKRDNADQSP